MDAIRVHDLTKCYGETLAVDAIDFTVRAGATVGLLGGNGAGKTTTILSDFGAELDKQARKAKRQRIAHCITGFWIWYGIFLTVVCLFLDDAEFADYGFSYGSFGCPSLSRRRLLHRRDSGAARLGRRQILLAASA
jgi:hypothetical protein